MLKASPFLRFLKNELLRETPAGVGSREAGRAVTIELDELGSAVVRPRRNEVNLVKESDMEDFLIWFLGRISGCVSLSISSAFVLATPSCFEPMVVDF